ncbi:hypothetical protein [Dokdonia sp.]|uniref:hypothetical protein n=1 Tax=Dokdonia sp. TaxID=2024995 RepID=UPI003265CAF7
MKDKRKSPNQNRFESSRRNYDEKEILMETLYNIRLTRDATLKMAKTINLMGLVLIIGVAMYLIKTVLTFF